MLQRLFLILLHFHLSHSLKFLAFSPQFAKSHVNFLGKLSDALVDGGHQVVMLSPLFDLKIGGAGTKKAQVIEVPQTETAISLSQMKNQKGSMNMWNMKHGFNVYKTIAYMRAFHVDMCEETLQYPGLLDLLRKEKFDAAFGESLLYCTVELFHLLGIDRFAFTESMASLDSHFDVSQTPTVLSYIPSAMHGIHGDRMTFFQRIENVLGAVGWNIVMERDLVLAQAMVERNWPGFPSIRELEAKASLVFYNSDPLVDFPKITSSRIIDIGGIAAANVHEPVNKTWSDILDLRPKTTLISFGTIAVSCEMPELYKKSIRDTARRFPDVTFVWKYEKPDHKVSDGVPNIVESTWLPQLDLLHDSRLTAFITHCGQGSLTEAYSAGVPLIVFPTYGDQLRNAQQVTRNGVGIAMAKEDLSSPALLEKAIRQILTDPSYRKRAEAIKDMLKDRPFAMKEVFVKNMEFVAKHGPLRQLDHYGRHLSIVQYYLIDIIALLFVVVVLAITVLGFLIRFLLKQLLRSSRIVSGKKNN